MYNDTNRKPKNTRAKLTITVNPQTMWNLTRLAEEYNCNGVLGKVIDNLVKEKMRAKKARDVSYDEESFVE